MASFTYRAIRVVAFGFKALNFFLDVWQTWQFTTGGGVAGVAAGIIAYFQDKPVWLVVVLAVAVAVFAACVISLFFKSRRLENAEGRRLKHLPKLVYDMHRRRCVVRERFVSKINWNKVDASKVVTRTFELLTEDGQHLSLDDKSVKDASARLDEMGSMFHGAPSVFLAMMKDSDTNMETAIEQDFRYRLMEARLDGFKPFPNEVIRKDVGDTLFDSEVFNHVLVYRGYMSGPLTVKALAEHTKLSDVGKAKIYLANANVEQKMEDTIDERTTKLREDIEKYLEGEGKAK